jgi:hypothetical protein
VAEPTVGIGSQNDRIVGAARDNLNKAGDCRILLVTPLPQYSKRGLCYRKEKGILLGIPFFDEPLYGDITLLCIGVVIAYEVVFKEVFGGIPAGHLAGCLVIVVGQYQPDLGPIRAIPVIGVREVHA